MNFLNFKSLSKNGENLKLINLLFFKKLLINFIVLLQKQPRFFKKDKNKEDSKSSNNVTFKIHLESKNDLSNFIEVKTGCFAGSFDKKTKYSSNKTLNKACCTIKSQSSMSSCE